MFLDAEGDVLGDAGGVGGWAGDGESACGAEGGGDFRARAEAGGGPLWGGSACAVDGEGEAEDVVGAVVVGFVVVGDAGDCGGDEAWADGGVVEPDGFVSGVGAALDDESGGGSAAGGDLGAAGVPLVSEGVEESCAGEERDEFSGWGRFCEVDSVGAEFDEDAEVVEGFEAAGGVVGADADGGAEGGEAGDTDGFGDEARGFGVAETEDLLGRRDRWCRGGWGRP